MKQEQDLFKSAGSLLLRPPLLRQTAKKAGTQPNSEEVFDTTEENSISMKQERDSFKSAKLKILNIFF